MSSRFITVAIHTYEKAVALRALLEREGIQVEFRNVNIEHPVVSSGVRVRIRETDLPLALRIIENREIFSLPAINPGHADTSLPILVPVDFTEQSFRAAAHAFGLAARHNSSVSLLHAYIDPYVAGNLQLTDSLTYEISEMSTREEIENTAKTQMRHFADRIREMIKKAELPPVKFSTSVVEGVPEDAIYDFTRSNSPFMIVMATRGPRRKELEMIGSVTAEVLDKCRIPTLALPENVAAMHGDKDGFKKILYLSNLDQQDILALDTIYRIYPNAGASVTIAHIPGKKRLSATQTEGSLKAICDYCTQNFKGYTFNTRVLASDNVADDVRNLENDGRFHLIAVPNKKKNIFSRLFSPNIVHRVLFAADIPLLVIPV